MIRPVIFNALFYEPCSMIDSMIDSMINRRY